MDTGMANSGLPTPKPPVDPAIATYWNAANEGRLVLPRCRACSLVIWYPRSFCPDCSSRDIEWFDSTGGGSVYSYTVTRRGQGAYRDSAPYVLAYVELDDGPRVLTNIVDVDVESPDQAEVFVGLRVVAVFDQVPETDTALLRFRPAD